MTIYITNNGNGYRGVYHTDKTCPHLKKSDKEVIEYVDSEFQRKYPHIDECKECADKIEYSDPDQSVWQATLNTEVESD